MAGLAIWMSWAAAFAGGGIASSLRVLTQDKTTALRQKVIQRFQAVDAQHRGLFNEDITDLVAPFFPPGQSLDDSSRTVVEQNAGRLRRFRGIMEPGDGAMFVADFNLVTATFSHVYVVIDLSFIESSEGGMVLRKSRAFLRSTNM